MRTITDATRWKAVQVGEDAYDVIVILVDLPGGGHIASVPSFETYGQACAATCAHANLIANAPLLLALLR